MTKLAKYLMIPFGMVQAGLQKSNPFVILMYHRINDAVSKEVSVTEADFRWQMEYLRRKGWHVITLDEALQSGDDASRKDKRVVLTFDDGYVDFYTTASPILAEYGYPSLVYILPGYIGTGKVLWWDRDIGESRLMNWEQIRKLASDGLVAFGSHTMTHPDFNRIGAAEAEDELRRSQVAISEKLGIHARHFAYPRGIVGHVESVGAVYDTAASIFDGYGSAHADRPGYRLLLQRLPVQRSDGKALFAARLHGWLMLEGSLKKLMGKR